LYDESVVTDFLARVDVVDDDDDDDDAVSVWNLEDAVTGCLHNELPSAAAAAAGGVLSLGIA